MIAKDGGGGAEPARAMERRARQAVPAWVQLMRDAAMDAIGEDDIRQIVANQVARAKKGDKNAIKFIFEQVLGGGAMKGATFVQNVYEGGSGDGRPDKPTKAAPGSSKKVETLRRRREAGEDLFNEADAGGAGGKDETSW